MKKNVAVVGMGYWGKNLVRNFSELGALHTICDVDAAVESISGEKYQEANFRADYEQVLADKEVEGIALATPAVRHYAMARQALEAGKDVFVEKPLAIDVKEGGELVRLAEAGGRILMVGHILRYHPAVIQLKKLLERGVLGEVRYLYSNRLNMGKIRTEENILWSFAPHDISVMLALLDAQPESVSCQGGAYISRDVYDVTTSEFVFPGGIRAHIFVSWLHPIKEQRLVVVGSDKMAVFDGTAENQLVIYPHRIEWKGAVPTAIKADAEIVPLASGEPLRAECAQFLTSIEARKSPITDGHEGLRVLQVLDMCQRSLAIGGNHVSAEG